MDDQKTKTGRTDPFLPTTRQTAVLATIPAALAAQFAPERPHCESWGAGQRQPLPCFPQASTSAREPPERENSARRPRRPNGGLGNDSRCPTTSLARTGGGTAAAPPLLLSSQKPPADDVVNAQKAQNSARRPRLANYPPNGGLGADSRGPRCPMRSRTSSLARTTIAANSLALGAASAAPPTLSFTAISPILPATTLSPPRPNLATTPPSSSKSLKEA